MVETITRFDLVRIDSAGDFDGTLTRDELERLDPQLAQQLEEEGLLDASGRLPYAQYVDTFADGWNFWAMITSRVEAIPLIEQLKLGRQMFRLPSLIRFGFGDPSRRGGDPLRELVNYKELAATIHSEQWFHLEREGAAEPYTSPTLPVDQWLYQDQGKDPAEIYARTAERYLHTAETMGLIRCSDPKDRPFCESIRRLHIYEPHDPAQNRELLQAVSALLVYESSYLFPIAQSCLWGYMIRRLDLTYNRDQLNIRGEELNGNPFRARFDPWGYYRIRWEGFFSQSGKQIALDANIMEGQSGQDTTWEPLAQNFKGKSHLAHEIGHAVLAGCYPAPAQGEKPLRFQAMERARYFSRLPQDLFAGIFLENMYGHVPDAAASRNSYDPVEETHSRLFQLATIGEDFPERIRAHLKAYQHWKPRQIQEVYEQLSAFRQILRSALAFQGHPSWADLLRDTPLSHPLVRESQGGIIIRGKNLRPR